MTKASGAVIRYFVQEHPVLKLQTHIRCEAASPVRPMTKSWAIRTGYSFVVGLDNVGGQRPLASLETGGLSRT